MRSSFVIALTAATIIVLAVVVGFRPRPSITRENDVSPAVVAPAPLQKEVVSSPTTVPVAVQNISVVSSPSEEELSQRLHEWGQDGSVEALTNIFNVYVTSPGKTLRLAAVEAVRQTSRREAVPFLQSAAEKASDMDEKNALLDVAVFLSGPTVVEQAIAPQPDTPN